MTYMPGEDAQDLREVVRAFLGKRSSEADVRRVMETEDGYDADVWAQMATELGLQGLVIPESLGGSGVTAVELGVVFEEMGRVLFSGPFLSTVGLAATALMQIEHDLAAETLAGIAAGDTIATATWPTAQNSTNLLRAEETERGWEVWGVADTVLDGATAGIVLVHAQSFDGPVLLLVASDPSLERELLVSMDSTRKLAKLTFDRTPASLLAFGDEADRVRDLTSDFGALYLAAEQLGGASQVLETAVDYAQNRVQFGRPIGSFQSIKHRCADMLIDVESARSVVWHGLWTAVHDPSSLPAAASLSRSLASDAYQRAAADNLQIHGGIGFTWEHAAHLYLKRSKSSQLLMGSPAHHRARLAGEVLQAASTEPHEAQANSSASLAQDDELTADLQAFLSQNPVPPADDHEADRRHRESRFDAGLAVVSYAPGHGGRGLAHSRQSTVEEIFTRAGAADHSARNIIGLGMALPTIHTHGTDAQKAKFLRPTFSGEYIWCQLFSEPGAGSDLAGLATRAVRDGDDFIVNGQKVWTSLGHVADWGILLARTDPNVPKHKGLTYFVLDMRTPGVEVRPLRQITGEAEFNEVYLTNVRIPAANILGAEGDGWRVAMTTLANERVTLGRRPAPRGSGPIGQAVRVYRDAAADGRVDAVVTERLMTLWTRAEAARLTNIRASAQESDPGPEGSIAKLQMAELHKAIYEFCVDLSGPDGLLVAGYDETAPTEAAVHGGADVRMAYLRSLANSIEGGTSEVLRNILGERVLGLPAEPRLDRDLPWKDVRRS